MYIKLQFNYKLYPHLLSEYASSQDSFGGFCHPELPSKNNNNKKKPKPKIRIDGKGELRGLVFFGWGRASRIEGGYDGLSVSKKTEMEEIWEVFATLHYSYHGNKTVIKTCYQPY